MLCPQVLTKRTTAMPRPDGIDGNITVKVVRIQGNRVTVGIEAPSGVKIRRGELAQPSTKTVELVFEDGLLIPCEV